MKDKVVVITGASSGIGKALAQYFGSKGSKVVITGRRLEALEAVKTSLVEQNIEVLAVTGDVSNPEDNQHMVKENPGAFRQN